MFLQSDAPLDKVVDAESDHLFYIDAHLFLIMRKTDDEEENYRIVAHVRRVFLMASPLEDGNQRTGRAAPACSTHGLASILTACSLRTRSAPFRGYHRLSLKIGSRTLTWSGPILISDSAGTREGPPGSEGKFFQLYKSWTLFRYFAKRSVFPSHTLRIHQQRIYLNMVETIPVA